MKTKPTQIIVHRIEFQQFERNLLENLNMAVIGSKIIDPIVEILKDVSAMATITSLYLLYRYGEAAADFIGDGYDSAAGVIKDGLKAVEWAKENDDLVKYSVGSLPVVPGVNIRQVFNFLDLIF